MITSFVFSSLGTLCFFSLRASSSSMRCLNQLLLSQRGIRFFFSRLLFWCDSFAHVKHFPFNSFPLLNRKKNEHSHTQSGEGKNKRQSVKIANTRQESVHEHSCAVERSDERQRQGTKNTLCNTHCKANIIVKLTIGMGMLTCAAWCCIECL